MRFAWLVLSVALCCLSPSMAAAQDGDTALARSEFERGRAAYESGAFEEALAAFQRAYELTGDAQILYNVATVADRLRRDGVALEAYEGYLAGYPTAPDRANVEARIRAIRAARPASTETDAVEVDATAGEGEADAEAESIEPSTEPLRRPVEAPASSNAREGGLVLTVAGGIIALAGAGLLIASAVEIEAASHATTWAELMGPYDRVPIVSASGVIALALGGAIAAVGIGWLITSGSSGDEPTVALRVGPGTLSIAGSF